uniref:S-adenosyl-L-methionine-dependent tRNA 4-demethylwyosine synthase n=1 Tax=Rhizophora mucronata TaxID=61149 RepID=A0A2P2KUD3_RHIMU
MHSYILLSVYEQLWNFGVSLRHSYKHQCRRPGIASIKTNGVSKNL